MTPWNPKPLAATCAALLFIPLLGNAQNAGEGGGIPPAVPRNTPPALEDADFAPAPPQPRTAPDYPIPYAPASPENIASVLERIRSYLEIASPLRVIDQTTNRPVTDLTHLPERVNLGRGDFFTLSYEWGVTYAGMLLAAEATGDARFKEYTGVRLETIARMAGHMRSKNLQPRDTRQPLRSFISPHSLDETGAMAAAMLKAQQAGVGGDLKAQIEFNLDYVSNKQMRLADGTLARSRPMPNTLWLDDLYMSVPALAQMGKFTGDNKYFDDAVKQILQFSQRMFVKEKGLYMHGWVEGMQEHPRFYWARANGWAIMAMTELLSVLPENHPGYAPVMSQFREHVRGLTATQGMDGLWHQLLNRPDTYEETSASAIYVYCLARAINRGWIDAQAYLPMTSLGWNAVAEKVNAQGQVQAVCVGTGMGWDPMFYAYRPTSVLAAHGYGPMLLAGAEMIALRRSSKGAIHSDGGLQFGPPPPREEYERWDRPGAANAAP